MLDQFHSYLLGLLQTDGHLSENSRNRGRISLDLSKRDIDILYKIKELISCNASIKEKITNTNFKDNYESAKLSIFNLEFRNFMKEHGLLQGRKTETKPPNTDYSVIDYYRGIIDGDGSLGITSNNIPYISLITKNDILKDNWLSFINKHTGLIKTTNRNKRDNAYNILVMKENAQILVGILYYKDCLCIARKYVKAQEVLNWIRPDDMKVRNYPVKKWTDEEDEFILSHTITESMLFTSRTEKSIKTRLWRLRKKQIAV